MVRCSGLTSFHPRQSPADEGEHEVLVLAEERDGKAILDDKFGRQIAEAEDIDYGGSIYLLIQLVKKDVLTPFEMRDTVNQMIKRRWKRPSMRSLVHYVRRLKN